MKERLHHVDGMRFVFSVIIVYFHILRENIFRNVEKVGMYYQMWERCDSARQIVDAFLIIGGFFLYQTYRNRKSLSILQFAEKRVLRLWPVLALNMLLMVSFFHYPIGEAIYDLAFLRNTGISLKNGGILWYIGPYFWCSLLIFAILKKNKDNGILIIGIMTYFAYVVHLNCPSERVSNSLTDSFLSLSMCRVFAGMGLGVLLAVIVEKWSKQNKRTRKTIMVMEDVTASFLFVFLLDSYIFRIWTKKPKSAFTLILAFLMLMLLLTRNNGWLIRKINHPWFGKLGRYSYAVYVMQQFTFYVFRRTLWKLPFIKVHAIRSVIISTALSVLIGIAVYYMVDLLVMKIADYSKQEKTVA